jgi:hypothetical protein
MKPKAYMVFGPESSGTRMMTQYIILNANTFGDWQHYQSLDREQTFQYLHPEANVTWRRSLPHGGSWPYIGVMKLWLQTRGFQVICIGTTRDRQKTIDSQFRHGHIKTTEQGLGNYKRAMEIVKQHADYVVQYEDFCSSKAYRKVFLKNLGLKFPSVEPMEIKARQH